MKLPHYYSSLVPFRKTFLGGNPVLTYHHVGPRRRGVRIKGLYVSAKLFERQIAELRAGGFQAASLDDIALPAPGRPRIFLTFDDGFRDVHEQALPVLSRSGCRAMQYLVSGLVGATNRWQQKVGDAPEPLMDEGQVREWLAAGQQIGSHTRSHVWLTRVSLADAREEISASRKELEDRFGVPVEHFCYPFGDWNPRVRDLVAAAGYKTACTTITGLNTPETSPFELKRFTARYPSRNLKAIWARLRGR